MALFLCDHSVYCLQLGLQKPRASAINNGTHYNYHFVLRYLHYWPKIYIILEGFS